MPNLKEFLEACEQLGTLRLIVTSSAAVLEVRGSIHKLFYAELPKGNMPICTPTYLSFT